MATAATTAIAATMTVVMMTMNISLLRTKGRLL
jgi:hypothetical protein